VLREDIKALKYAHGLRVVQPLPSVSTNMSSPASLPSLNVPASSNTVDVYIIDTTTCVNGLPVSAFMNPQVPGMSMIVDGCSYSFLIKRKDPSTPSKYDNLLFDLGARKDSENGPTVLVEQAKQMGFSFSVDKDVATILKDDGVDLSSIGGIIWSHYHAVRFSFDVHGLEWY
jgi:hypothetical protein